MLTADGSLIKTAPKGRFYAFISCAALWAPRILSALPLWWASAQAHPCQPAPFPFPPSSAQPSGPEGPFLCVYFLRGTLGTEDFIGVAFVVGFG
ncbi:hypothetical protein, partial [Brucella abortus]|uniref:hypothetical protein n=1 Tax=Brucella abortus TaxID=235 RepID=UPI001AEBEC9E